MHIFILTTDERNIVVQRVRQRERKKSVIGGVISFLGVVWIMTDNDLRRIKCIICKLAKYCI